MSVYCASSEDEGASLHLERVFEDDGADGAWNAGEDVSDDDDQFDDEQQQCALSNPERFTRDQLDALNLTVSVSRDVYPVTARTMPRRERYHSDHQVRLESNANTGAAS